MSWETIKKNMEEHNGKYRPEQSTAGNSVGKEERQNNRNFWNNTRDIFVNTLKDTAIDQTKSFVKTGEFNRNDVWNRVQNIANNNLNRFNEMQKSIDVNTRNQMAQNMEDFTNRKRTAMQNASNYVQEKNRQEERKRQEESDKKENDKVLLFNNMNKSQKDTILSSRNKKVEIEKQIEQENSNNLLEQVYNQKNTPQENKKMYSIDKKVSAYEKNLAMHKQSSKDKESSKKNNTILQDMEDIAGIGGLGTKTSTLDRVSNFARAIQDTIGVGKEVGLGVSTGAKQVLNYIESANENIGNYKKLRENQFLTSPNVSMEDKTAYKMGENVETNLVKKAIRESIANDEQKIQEIQEGLNYKISQKFGEIAPSMGQMIPGTALSAINPALGTAYFMTSAGGGYINDALSRGMTEEQAFKYGTIMGALEGASESFITGQQLNKISNAFGGKRISKEVLDSYGFNIFENAMQEAVMEPAQEITAGIVGDKADWSNMEQRMAESGFNGALMGAITNGVTYGLEKSGSVYNKIKNNEQVTVSEYKEALQENIDKFGKKAVEDSIRQGALETYQEINNTTNLQQNDTNNPINPLIQQTNSQENKVAQNGNVEQIKIDSENFARQVDDVLRGEFPQRNMLVLGNTPQVLKDIGLTDLPITMTQKHLDTIMNSSGKYKNANYHNLGIDIVKQLPEAINNPLDVVKSNTKNDSIVLTTYLADKNNNPVIASIKIDGKGTIDDIRIDTNVMTSAYGKSNYDSFMSKNVNEGNLLYDIDRGVLKKLTGQGSNYLDALASSDTVDNVSDINNSIAQNDNSVKNTITNNYAQSNRNNSITKDNLANNQQTVYNNTESEGGINGRSQFTNKQEGTTIQSINETRTRNNELSQQRNDTSIQQNSQYGERKYNNREQSIVQKIVGSESDSNGKIQRFQRLSGQFDTNISKENSKQETRKYNRQEYEKWEQSIKPREERNLTIKEKIIKDNIKNQYEKDIVFFDDENSQEYISGASLNDKRKIYIDKKTANDFGINKVINHEIMESDIRHNRELSNEIIKPSIDKIIEDKNFEKQKKIFWENQDGEIPSNFAVAKELLCDRFAEIKSGENLDYKNVLSQETNMTIDYALENFHNQLYGKNINEQTNTDSQLSEVEANTGLLGYKSDMEGKQRKHYKSIMESDQVGETGKQSAKSLLENDTYEPLSNVETLATANANINRNGVDNTYVAFRSKINSNERITLQDIATGERLIQIFSQGGDFEKVNGLIQDVAMLGTELGQQVQAMSLIKRMSPEGQLMYLQKVVERTNIKENTDLKVSEDMSKRILETKNQEELENVMTDIAIELGEQLPVTMGDKVRSWRYLSMLGNPKTHIKNLGANVAMNVTQQTKNKVAGAMEDVAGIFNKDMERTKTLRPANQDQRNFAKQDAEFMKDKIDGGGKYDIKNAIQSNKKQFDGKVLNAIANFNSNMLELEDNTFLKKAYKQALQNYMSANKLSSSDMQNSAILQKAREYASYQAQEATFHQFSALAQRLTEIENKGGIAGKALEAVVPFKKTPINIAKSGIEYSPIGLAKSITYDIVQLKKKTKDYKSKLEKGFISEAEYKTGTSKLVTKMIDNMAKGLTGTSLALLGYALKDMAILKSGNDDEDDEFKEKLGEQEYAIRIGDNTYTLDWVSPSAIPMFIGATVHDLVHSENEDNSNTLNSLLTSSAKALEPMTEMSMLQGLTSAISSYEQGSSNMIFDLGASAVSSYFGQFVPTALGQVAKTIDDKERDTSSTEKGFAKKVDQFKKQQMAKIPIVSKMLPVRKDVWGNEKTRNSNPLMRAYEVGLAPYNRKKVVEDYTEKELLKVFEDTGEKSVLPGIPNKDITIDKQKYRLTAGEYNKAKESFGKTSKSMLDSLVKTNEYKQLSDAQKVVAIDNIYSYAKEKIKIDYAKNKKQEVEPSSSYNILNELKSPSNQSEYISYSAKIQGIEKDTEKKKILAGGKYSNTTKEIIYKNTLGKEDDLYNNVLASDNININEYLNYKLQNFESDKEDDGTVKGKTIKGSKLKKVSDYVENMNITKNQQLAILGTQYKLDRNEQIELYNYINNIPRQTQDKKLEIFLKYSRNFIVNENNTVDFK